MKNILLPTDFSENSRNAILYAFYFFENEPCRFIFLHSYKINGYQRGSKLSAIPDLALQQEMQTASEKKLQHFITGLPRLHSAGPDPELKMTSLATNDPLIESIQQQIREKDIDLVIIGTQGDTGAYEVVYGSNTINIMEEIQGSPVLAVPAHVVYQPIEEIVLVDGFKLTPSSSDLELLKDVASRKNAAVRILHIAEEGGLSEQQEKNRQLLDTHLGKIPHTFHSLEYLSIPMGIYSFTESRGSSLIAFINKKHSFVENLLFNPLYKNLGHYSKVPVLVLHHRQTR